MSQTHINYNDKYHREIKFSSTGVINTKHTVSLSRDKDQYLSTENTIRMTAKDVGATNVIEIQVKLLTETTWTTLGILTGPTTATFDIRTWDQLRYEVTTYDGIAAEGTLYASGFIETLPQDPAAVGECVKICDDAGNEIDLQLIDGVWSFPIVELSAPCVPTVTNVTIPATATIYSHTFTSGTKKFIVKHRNGGNIELGFSALLPAHMTIPKGNAYEEHDLNIQGVTLYFRSNKSGTLEIIEWV